MGIVAAGGADSPARLVHAIGEEATAELWRFSRAASDRLIALDPNARRGVWRLSLHDSEAQEWALSKRLLTRWKEPDVQEPDPTERASRAGLGFVGGVHVGRDGVVDLTTALSRFDEVPLHAGVARITEGGGRVQIERRGAEPIQAEIAIVAAGVGCGTVHPFFSDLLYPVRFQGRRSRSTKVVEAAVARHRHEAWCGGLAGDLEFLGCRWAEQPEMEAGVLDDTEISEAIAARQDAFVETHLGGAEGSHRWSGVTAHSCDGLPILGPLPGAPRIIALTGWGGWGLSWIGEAVEVVARAILGEATERSMPKLLEARRML
jgi:glycine/D-amino acid oxidase-like deaminating enzyme